jgi:hypothetical protein
VKVEDILTENLKDFRKDLFFEIENIETSMTVFAVKYFDIGYLYTKYLNDYVVAKKQLDSARSLAYRRIKTNADINKIKITEKALEYRIDKDDEYNKAYQTYLTAKNNYELYKVMKESLDKKDKMIELAMKAMDLKIKTRMVKKGESNGI